MTQVYVPLFSKVEESANNDDIMGAGKYLQQIVDQSYDLLDNVQDDRSEQLVRMVISEVEPQLEKVNAGMSSKQDILDTVDGLTFGLREVLAWAAGTVNGIGNAAVKGVEGAVDGLVNGLNSGNLLNAVTGAVNGAVNGIGNGAGDGFARGFGKLLQG